jgi:hypothetical protein
VYNRLAWSEGVNMQSNNNKSTEGASMKSLVIENNEQRLELTLSKRGNLKHLELHHEQYDYDSKNNRKYVEARSASDIFGEDVQKIIDFLK